MLALTLARVTMAVFGDMKGETMGMWAVRAIASIGALGMAMADRPARAQTITLRDPDLTAELLRVEGYEASADQTRPGENPVLTANDDGLKFGLYFANCDEGKECQSVEFHAGFKNHKLTLETINEWNREKRFVRAYLDKDGDVALSMDVKPGGMERKLFVDHLAIWSSLLAQFEDRAYPPEPDKKPASAK